MWKCNPVKSYSSAVRAPFRQCLHDAEQQQQSLRKVHPAAVRQVPAVTWDHITCMTFSHFPTFAVTQICSPAPFCSKVSALSWGVCADIFTGEDQGGLPTSQWEKLPHLLPGQLTVDLHYTSHDPEIYIFSININAELNSETLTFQMMKGATDEQRKEWMMSHHQSFVWLPNSEKTVEGWCPFDVYQNTFMHLLFTSFIDPNHFLVYQ